MEAIILSYYKFVILDTEMEIKTEILLGDCKEKLLDIPNDSIDLIITSPP